MNVAFFDLDGTLLDGDTDVLWGQVLSEHGVFDPEIIAAFQATSDALVVEGLTGDWPAP